MSEVVEVIRQPVKVIEVGVMPIGPGSGGGGSSTALLAHINATEPHPAYDDDIPSLTLLFENGII